MSYNKDELILIDYDYLSAFQIKERIEDCHLFSLLERLSHYYNLGIISNSNLNTYLQKKKSLFI